MIETKHYGRKGHPPEDELQFSLYGCYVAHKLLKLPKQKWRQAYIGLTKDLKHDPAKFKQFVWDVIKDSEHND